VLLSQAYPLPIDPLLTPSQAFALASYRMSFRRPNQQAQSLRWQQDRTQRTSQLETLHTGLC
jgi:hypothetical protein